jgi:hypothetical protein
MSRTGCESTMEGEALIMRSSAYLASALTLLPFSAMQSASTSTVIIRPKSGNPGYIVGLPVLSGFLTSQALVITSTTSPATTNVVTKMSIVQDVGGLTLLPIASSTCGVWGHGQHQI